ncbi:hypothetical protein ACHAWF_014740, partial [Thalassiosira exigua]
YPSACRRLGASLAHAFGLRRRRARAERERGKGGAGNRQQSLSHRRGRPRTEQEEEERRRSCPAATMAESTPRNVRWAILGTGSIANDMVQILKQLPRTEVLAVGSRSVEGAKRFGDRWGIPRQYGSYEEAASDKDVDVCYIATPSLRHPQDSLLAMKNGKAVLCEKSMAPDAKIAREVLDAAKNSNLLFVHGVWSRFFPAMKKIRQIIESGEIGTVRSARASFCQNDGAGSCSALLETGIYCAQFLQWALEDPNDPGSDSGDGPVVRGA